MFSRSCEHALRAVIIIASKSERRNIVKIDDIIEGTGAPKPFLLKILQHLAKHGIIKSQKGPNGGFYITEEGLNLRVADIVTAIDGDKLYKKCVLGLKICSEENPCPLHHDFKFLRKDIVNMIENHKIRDLASKISLGEFFLNIESQSIDNT